MFISFQYSWRFARYISTYIFLHPTGALSTWSTKEYLYIYVIPKRDTLTKVKRSIYQLYVKFLHFRILLLTVITSELSSCFFFPFSPRDYGMQFTTIREKSDKQIILSFQKSISKLSICTFNVYKCTILRKQCIECTFLINV